MQRFITHQRGLTAMIVRVVATALTLTLAGLAMADPPARVARLAYLTGGVSFSPAGENDWVTGTLNRPLVTGDRLWASKNARVELQIGNASVRLSTNTLFTLTNLDDRIAQMRLQEGTLLLRVRRVDRDQVIEVGTPNLAFVIRQPGEYRITVNADADSTEVITRSGRATVFDAGARYSVAAGRGFRFFGAGLEDYDVVAVSRPDDFDRWSQTRDRGYETSISARYVSRDLIGYQDLDEYGSWSSVPEYGNIWMPTRVAANWAPYRDGHWSWIEPWGWTWVDDQPWGFAVSHYGRWTNTSRGWGWVPGPIAARPVYAPALVAFIGGSNFQVSLSSGNVGAVGWFPLAPREVYRPAYAVSRDYFTNVNISNTVINNTVIVNNYENRNAPVVRDAIYVNRAVLGAVVAVPTTAFVQSQPVARSVLRVTEAAFIQAPLNTLAPVAPTRVSVLGGAPQQQAPPPVVERRVVAQSQPPAAPVGFAVRERALSANPGKPLEAAALAALKPAAPPVVAPAPPAAPGKPGVVAAPGVPAAPPRVEIVQPRSMGPDSAALPPPPAKPQADRRGNAGQPPVAIPAPRDPNPVVPQGQAQPPVITPPQELVRPGNRPTDQRGPPARGVAPAPAQVPPNSNLPTPPQLAQPVAPAPVVQPPGQRGPNAMPPQQQGDRINKQREQRELPANPAPAQVDTPPPATAAPPAAQPARPAQPAQPGQPAQPAQPAQPPRGERPPAAAPAERGPNERQRGRPDRPGAATPAPATEPGKAAAPGAVEPAKPVSPEPTLEAGDQIPRVVEENKDDKRRNKKGEKPDKDDDEKKRK